MYRPNCKSASLILFAFAGLLSAQNVLPPGTEVNKFLDPPSVKTFDANWSLLADSINGEPADAYISQAVIVSKVANGWTSTLAGTTWISTAADQSTGTRAGTTSPAPGDNLNIDGQVYRKQQ